MLLAVKASVTVLPLICQRNMLAIVSARHANAAMKKPSPIRPTTRNVEYSAADIPELVVFTNCEKDMNREDRAIPGPSENMLLNCLSSAGTQKKPIGLPRLSQRERFSE